MDAADCRGVELSRKLFAKHKFNFLPATNFDHENYPFTGIPKDLYQLASWCFHPRILALLSPILDHVVAPPPTPSCFFFKVACLFETAILHGQRHTRSSLLGLSFLSFRSPCSKRVLWRVVDDLHVMNVGNKYITYSSVNNLFYLVEI